jgi:hypothetical protein
MARSRSRAAKNMGYLQQNRAEYATGTEAALAKIFASVPGSLAGAS